MKSVLNKITLVMTLILSINALAISQARAGVLMAVHGHVADDQDSFTMGALWTVFGAGALLLSDMPMELTAVITTLPVQPDQEISNLQRDMPYLQVNEAVQIIAKAKEKLMAQQTCSQNGNLVEVCLTADEVIKILGTQYYEVELADAVQKLGTRYNF